MVEIDQLSKETRNPFLDSFGFKNRIQEGGGDSIVFLYFHLTTNHCL